MKPTLRIHTFLATLLLAAAALGTQAASPTLVPPTESYAGKSHAQWLESWFTWMFSIQGEADEFPFLDVTGANSGANQSGPVFFFPKSWAGQIGNPPEQRTATVPEGTALFLPFDGNYIDPQPGRDPATITAENRAALESWVSVFKLVVDGQEIPIDSRVTSPFLHASPVFSLAVPTNAAARKLNFFSNLPTEIFPYQSHEWFVLLKPLPVGQHVVHSSNNGFIGSPNEWVTDVVWTLNVVAPTPKNPPTITKNPANQSRSLGDQAELTVTANGPAPLTYQWRKDGAPLAGQTAPTLTLTNLIAAAAGTYSVVISNTDGSVTSNDALLTVDTLFRVIADSPVARDVSWSASWGDYDNDGFIDLVNGGQTEMLLYRNEGGKVLAAVSGPNGMTGTAHVRDNVTHGNWADYDNDGHLDLFVAKGWYETPDTNSLFRGTGGGAFAIEPTLSKRQRAISAQWSDFDRDGRLDILLDSFVCCTDIGNILAIYRGQSDGGFTRWRPSGLSAAGTTAWFVGSSVGDYNADGFPDIASWNPVSGLRVLLNQAGTNFARGGYSLVPEWGKQDGGVSAADFDNDGDLDLFHSHRNSSVGLNYLLRNDGTGRFASAPVPPALRQGKSYSSSWGDYDNDGYLDLFTHDGLWRNQGNGTFARVEGGSLTTSKIYRWASASWGDYDNDGFLDLVVSGRTADSVFELNKLFRNNGNGNSWLLLKLVGTKSNRSAIGAKIRLRANLGGSSVLQYREIGTGNCYGQNDLRAHFGLADATQAESIEIEWPSGYRQTLRSVAGKQILTITEPADQPRLVFSADRKLQVTGAVQTSYRIESSEDLLTWTDRPDLTVKTDDAGKASVSMLNTASGSVPAKEFFRVRVL